jgi:hypothetical protein
MECLCSITPLRSGVAVAVALHLHAADHPLSDAQVVASDGETEDIDLLTKFGQPHVLLIRKRHGAHVVQALV